MSNSGKTWEVQVLAAIRGIAGAVATDELEARWFKHAALKVPVVTLFGSYDSGKSTLLKRLLADAGVAIPDWLTIGARRDTFEVNEIQALGCLFRDTPGIASGNADHECLAREATITTDVILVILPPQLITGDREAICAVASGEIFRTGGMQLGEALALVMCKMDEGGYNPEDDPTAYNQYLKEKREELINILNGFRADADPEKIFGVAADPFQTVVNAKNPGRSRYDSFRDWDGVGALNAWLCKLPQSIHSLRSLARKRFLLAAAEAHRTALILRIADVDLGLQETTANEERFTLLRQQLDVLVKQARISLDATIEEELAGAARARLDDESTIANFVEPRLIKAIALWSDHQSAELDALITNADAEVQARSESRGEKNARRLFEENTDDPEGQIRQNTKRVKSLAEKAKKALLSQQEQVLGMKLEKARSELKKLDEAKSFREYFTKGKQRGAFPSLKKAEGARKIVRLHTIFETLGPLILELGTLLWEEKQRKILEKRRVERRNNLQAMIRQEAKEIGNDSWEEWKTRATEFEAWLLQRQRTAHAMSEPLNDELQSLNVSKEEFSRLLAMQ